MNVLPTAQVVQVAHGTVMAVARPIIPPLHLRVFC